MEFGLLILFVLGLEIIHTVMVQKTLNKFLSRNYSDYSYANGLESQMRAEAKQQAKGMRVPVQTMDGVPENLEPLSMFGTN